MPTSLFNEKTIDGNHFNFSNGLIVGSLDLAHKQCSMATKNALFSNPTTRIFEQFLYQLYYTLLENKYGNTAVSKFLLHSSGVLKDGVGHVFVGASGSGKSTVAQLSDKYDIVNDEICLIERADDGYILQATPFNGYFRMKKNMSGPLKKIFILKQDYRHYIKKIARADYLAVLFRELVTPMNILSPSGMYALPQLFDCVIQLLEKVDCYELHFLPDNTFWRCIEELE